MNEMLWLHHQHNLIAIMNETLPKDPFPSTLIKLKSSRPIVVGLVDGIARDEPAASSFSITSSFSRSDGKKFEFDRSEII